jgi:hypothetical protein
MLSRSNTAIATRTAALARKSVNWSRRQSMNNAAAAAIAAENESVVRFERHRMALLDCFGLLASASGSKADL